MGADSAKGREEEAKKLLRWGQQNFTTVQILHRRKKVGTERIWYGDKENIALGTEQEFWMVLPKAEILHISKPNIPLMVKSSPRQLAPISG